MTRIRGMVSLSQACKADNSHEDARTKKLWTLKTLSYYMFEYEFRYNVK
jgi:hypothetical protein